MAPDEVVGPVHNVGPPGAPAGSGFTWEDAVKWSAISAAAPVEAVTGGIVGAVGWLFGSPSSPVHKAYASVSGAVTHFVHDAISWAISIVMSVVGAVHLLVTELFTLVHTAQKAADSAIGWIHNAPSWFMSNITKAEKWIDTSIVQPAVHLAMNAAKSAEHGLSGAISTVEKWVTKLVHGLIDPIIKQLQKLPGEVAKYADEAVHVVVQDAVQPIEANVAQMGDALGGLVKAITPDVLTALKMLVEAGEWIIWFGEHTFEDLGALMSGYAPTASLTDVQKRMAGEAATDTGIEEVLKGFFT